MVDIINNKKRCDLKDRTLKVQRSVVDLCDNA